MRAAAVLLALVGVCSGQDAAVETKLEQAFDAKTPKLAIPLFQQVRADAGGRSDLYVQASLGLAAAIEDDTELKVLCGSKLSELDSIYQSAFAKAPQPGKALILNNWSVPHTRCGDTKAALEKLKDIDWANVPADSRGPFRLSMAEALDGDARKQPAGKQKEAFRQAIGAYAAAVREGADFSVFEARVEDAVTMVLPDAGPALSISSELKAGGNLAAARKFLLQLLTNATDRDARAALLDDLMGVLAANPFDLKEYRADQARQLSEAIARDPKSGAAGPLQRLISITGEERWSVPTTREEALTLIEGLPRSWNLSLLLSRAGDAFRSAGEPSAALARYTCAWRVDSQNTEAALRSVELQDVDQATAEKRRAALIETYTEKTLPAIMSRQAERSRTYNPNDLANVLRAFQLLQVDKDKTDKLVKKVADSAKHLRDEQLAAPAPYLFQEAGRVSSELGKTNPAADYYWRAAADWNTAGYLDDARKALQRAIELRPSLDKRFFGPSQLLAGSAGFIGKLSTLADRQVTVTVRGQDNSEHSLPTPPSIGQDGAFEVHFATPLQTGDTVTVAYTEGRRSVSKSVATAGVGAAKDKAVLRVPWDGDRIVAGIAQRQLQPLLLEVSAGVGNCRQQLDLVRAEVAPSSRSFEAHLHAPLVGGERVTLRDRTADASAAPLAEETVSMDEPRLRQFFDIGYLDRKLPASSDRGFTMALLLDYPWRTAVTRGPARKCAELPLRSTVLVNSYVEIRMRSSSTLLNRFEVGTYLPVLPAWLRWSGPERSHGLFVAPIAVAGTQDEARRGPDGATQRFYPTYAAVGGRFGDFRFFGSSRAAIPSLRGYIDILWGRSKEFDRPLQRWQFRSFMPLPNTDFGLGIRVRAGAGYPTTREIFIGFHVDLAHNVGQTVQKGLP